ncbi:MAG TPA: 16S rRNA (guanine(527)-N(7))-methyltransferase RsmG [Candidatus Dormibacteraeota bacterium]|nr:16S rRNA (guanine(527)-N(7))-methyltransferase RsmG [Candidatus Dormibacteraeota bacterium]
MTPPSAQHPARARLDAYVELLLEANRRVNLTAARTPEAIWEHVEDSLTVAPFVRGELVDVGSGGGLPAIPLAIVCGVPVTMIEAVAKKAAFLRAALSELGLAGEVVVGRAESVGHDPAYRERFETATARAVSTAPTVLELTLPLLRVGGRAVLQRGRLDEAERRALEAAAPMLGGGAVEEHLLGGERRLLVIEKRTATPVRFPRRVGVPEKRPLCL